MNHNLKDILRKFRNKKLLTQLFTVMVAFSGILMTVVSMVVNHQTTATFLKNNNLIYTNTLEVSIKTLDTLFSGFHNSLTHITYDASIVDSVVTPKPLNSVANYQVWSVLNGYCQETEGMEEIYLYIRETSQILTSTYEKCSLDFFRERDLVDRHFASRPSTVLLKSGRTTSIEIYKGRVYMVRDFPLNGKKGLGTLFMKMKSSVLYDALEAAQTSYSHLLAYDNDFNPLFPGMLDYEKVPEGFIEMIPGYIKEGKNTVYSENQHYYFCQSNQTGINLVLLVDDMAFMPSSRMVLMNSLPYFALILILSTLLSVCVLYLSYMPVQKLKKMVSSEDSGGNSADGKNEWDYLTESFLKISNHKYQLDYILSNMIPKISKEFYFDLLNGKPMDIPYIQNILTNISSPLNTENPCKVITLTFRDFVEPILRHQFADSLNQILRRNSDGICRYVLQQIDDSLYAVIIQFDADLGYSKITDFEIKLEQSFFQSTDDRRNGVLLEIGPKCSSIQNVSFSYQESLERLARQKYPSQNAKEKSVSTEEDSVKFNYHFFQLQMKSISALIMKGDTDSALKKALHICHTLPHDGNPEEICRAYEYYRLAFLNTLASYRITDSDEKEYAFLFDPEPYSDKCAGSPICMQEFMVPFCTAAVNLLSEKYLKQQHKYLIRAKRCIEENYADPNLSLNLLADQCKTTTSYLSRLFKESFGINFVDYLNQYRIEKAKELLLSTGKPIKEIASTTGFNSQQNFIRVFKKHTGTTPGQFKSEKVHTN
ncbi:hypothetical protein LAD12857_42170 [Lacrimispora amygdalina]|uniref:HTH araC/xylS-type domain-containing protein n=1 Tax=Lacrimispora amygdalina TaxID=253257 RepID=A0ABQ5MBV5_9FIRM